MLKKLSPEPVKETTLAGEPIIAKLTTRPGQRRPHRRTESASRKRLVRRPPSGTENIYKIYAESFLSEAHLQADHVGEARQIVKSGTGDVNQDGPAH